MGEEVYLERMKALHVQPTLLPRCLNLSLSHSLTSRQIELGSYIPRPYTFGRARELGPQTFFCSFILLLCIHDGRAVVIQFTPARKREEPFKYGTGENIFLKRRSAFYRVGTKYETSMHTQCTQLFIYLFTSLGGGKLLYRWRGRY